MQRIPTKVWSHESVDRPGKQFVSEVLVSASREVESFQDLVRQIAKVSFYNPEHVLFFRGQTTDHAVTVKSKDKAEKVMASSIYPSIYRNGKLPLSAAEIATRFDRLAQLSEQLPSAFKEQEIAGHEKLSKFPELAWAILQHYGVCPTPLVDVTNSLRVAASFALNGSNADGYVYVFGFPHPNGSISYSVDSELLNIRLLSVCPPEAHRPHFQEGFLVGTFPTNKRRKHFDLDIGRRMIAKFKLPRSGFWSDQYHQIPNGALYPSVDRVKDLCNELGNLPPPPPRRGA